MSLLEHLEGGVTTVARAWAITRRDGVVMGFTDHDQALAFDGLTFFADAGLSAQALETSTGLSVDNSEALGALSHSAISEADLLAGRFDGADVVLWLVNWNDVGQRKVLFRGEIGEVSHGAGGFRAELRGMTERLGQPQGRVFQSGCSARLGDAACGVGLDDPAFRVTRAAEGVEGGKVLTFGAFESHDDRWFERGTLEVLSGAARGVIGIIKSDRLDGSARRVELWEDPRAKIAPGDEVRLTAGCDRRSVTCRVKFDNMLNFQGFPHVPGEDWLMAYPRSDGSEDGGGYTEGDRLIEALI